jgi:intracellular septation protein A
MRLFLTSAVWVVPLCFAWLWRPRQAPSPSAWLLLLLFGALGVWALWFGFYDHAGEPPAFVFWRPTVLYWSLAAIMIVVPLLGAGYPAKIVLGTYFAFSNREWRWINGGVAIVYVIMGGANALVAAQASYDDWVGYKFALMMNLLIIVLFRLNFVWLPILAEVAVHSYRHATAAYRYVARYF